MGLWRNGNASDYGSEDSRFDPWQARIFLIFWLFHFLFVLTWAQTIFSNAQKEKEKTINKIEEDISILESRRNRIYDNLNAIPVHYRKTEIIRYIYHAVSTSDYTIKEAIDLYDRNEQRKIDEARLREQQIYNQLQEEANAYADEMNDLQREANETAAKARRDMNIANAANIYQNHKRNKMLDRMNKK